MDVEYCVESDDVVVKMANGTRTSMIRTTTCTEMVPPNIHGSVTVPKRYFALGLRYRRIPSTYTYIWYI